MSVAAVLLATVLTAGCALAGDSTSPTPSAELSAEPRAGDTANPSIVAGHTYAGQLLGFTIADVEALAADRGLECAVDEPIGYDVTYFCSTSTPEFETSEWFMISGHAWGDEAYNLTVFASTAPPNQRASRDAAADMTEALMPWIADLGWYRSGDFNCGAGRQGDREYNNFGPDYSICAISDPSGEEGRSPAALDIATEPNLNTPP